MIQYILWAQLAQMLFLGLRPQCQDIFEISWFYWIHLRILSKMKSCFLKLKLGCWTYALIHLVDPISRNLGSRPQTPRSRNFLRSHDFIGFISWFLRELGPVCDSTNGLISPLLKDLGPNCPKLVFMPQIPNDIALGSENFFIKLHKILHQLSSYFFGHFGQSVYSQKIAKKKPLQKSSFWCRFR